MTEQELQRRVDAMAVEYRGIIASLTERCVILAVANSEAAAEIARLKEPKEPDGNG